MKLDISAQIAHGGAQGVAAALLEMGVNLPARIIEDFVSPAGIALVVRKPDGSCSGLMRSGKVHWNVSLPSNVAAILYTAGHAKVVRIPDEAQRHCDPPHP
jgi:hypothetical protein